MRMNFSTIGWIMCVLVTFYAQDVVSKSLACGENQYLKDSRCCDKCKPGSRVLLHCTEAHQTTCSKCNHHEYQPGWTEDMTCIQKKYCDTGKGFMSRNEKTESRETEEPCRCKSGYQCHPINCEYCELIPTCDPGFALEPDPGSTNGRKVCVACKSGFYSPGKETEQCIPWRNCKAEGRSEIQPGSAQADAVCGEHVPGAMSSWVLVSVLSVITVLCLLILLLFCYKDKLKLLSVNLRSCVQNLKRSRIQQETLAPLYHSRTAAEVPGSVKCPPCEMTKLICQAPHSPESDPPCTFPAPISCVRVSLPSAEGMAEKEGVKVRTATEDDSKGSGEPEELSEEEVVNASPLLAGSCACFIPLREPLEVGENEDCSQAVIPGTPGTCSCGGLDGERDGVQNGKEDRKDSDRAGEGSDQEKMSETCVPSLVSLSPPLIHSSSAILPSSPLPELCVQLSQAQARPQARSDFSDKSLIKQEEFYRLVSADSTLTENSAASAMTLVSALVASTSAGDLYLDKPAEASGISCRENKLSLEESELGCSPESLHSQLVEPSLTSGLVSGNHNTTFISSGQVMNVTGDVIVVYVSQTSQSGDEGNQDGAFGSPVQEEASETALFFQSSLSSQRDSISQNTLQEETLPVQEMIEASLLGK